MYQNICTPLERVHTHTHTYIENDPSLNDSRPRVHAKIKRRLLTIRLMQIKVGSRKPRGSWPWLSWGKEDRKREKGWCKSILWGSLWWGNWKRCMHCCLRKCRTSRKFGRMLSMCSMSQGKRLEGYIEIMDRGLKL